MTAKNFNVFTISEAGNIFLLNQLLEQAGEGPARKEVVNTISLESKLTPLMSACKGGDSKEHIAVIKVLLDAGADVDSRSAQGVTALHIAARRSKGLDLVKLLVEKYKASLEHRTREGQTVADWATAPEVKEYLLSKM
jgi:ankyrin repeat protein